MELSWLGEGGFACVVLRQVGEGVCAGAWVCLLQNNRLLRAAVGSWCGLLELLWDPLRGLQRPPAAGVKFYKHLDGRTGVEKWGLECHTHTPESGPMLCFFLQRLLVIGCADTHCPAGPYLQVTVCRAAGCWVEGGAQAWATQLPLARRK